VSRLESDKWYQNKSLILWVYCLRLSTLSVTVVYGPFWHFVFFLLHLPLQHSCLQLPLMSSLAFGFLQFTFTGLGYDEKEKKC